MLSHGPNAMIIGQGKGRAPRFLWTMAEDDKIRKLHPDFVAMQAELPSRSRKALWGRAQKLGLARRRRKWTPERDAVLKQVMLQVTDREVAAFMGGTAKSIGHRRRRLGGTKSGSDTKPARSPLIQDVISIAEARHLKLGKITRALRSRRIKPSTSEAELGLHALLRVVSALGGELYVEWDD